MMAVRVLIVLDEDNRFLSHLNDTSVFLTMRFDLSITPRFF